METRARTEEILFLGSQVEYKNILIWNDPKYPGYSRLRMQIGEPTEYDIKAVERRLKGKPRLSISPPKLAPESFDYDLSKYAPFALCLGSGLSAESGLPLLGSIHNLFEVDNVETGQLIFGAEDNLPQRMTQDSEGEFLKFCQFTIDAIKAKPSVSHQMIADLYRKGIINQVFTDNMDNILAKVNVPYTKTRQGIFPDRYPVKFDPNVRSLLAIGVAVDRRSVIRQARAARLPVIAINPVFGVAPHSRNMDYMIPSDTFFKNTANEILPRIVSASNF